MKPAYSCLALCCCVATLLGSGAPGYAVELLLTKRYQTETTPGSGRFHQLHKVEPWRAGNTAVIVCDVWDLHHSLNAVRRVEEIGPRLNEFLKAARELGMTVIHAPSDCMDAYADHPARRAAQRAEKAKNLPADIKSWCSKLPVEEGVVYPLDQSDGGDDDDPVEHAAWVERLKALGRNPGTPWKKQSEMIEIDADRDYISDRGEEIWNVLEEHGLENVILTGVHTNMCVLGRPFGLRQLVRNGKQVVLVRDLTDTMYNPASWPYVSHFTGTDRIISHIERHICPTITSASLLGGQPIRFKNDKRPHLVMLIAEDEYETNRTLPEFAAKYLGKQFRVSFVYDSSENIHHLPGLEVLEDADALLVSVRRRPLPKDQLETIRKFVASGKPVIGIRTANHAFSARRGKTSAELVQWPEFDAEVFGGNYHGHHGNQLKSTVSVAKEAGQHPILADVPTDGFAQGGSLYMVSPLAKGTTPLLTANIKDKAPEPVAWTFQRADKGKSFYTSLGHKDDFQNPAFVRLLYNAICWATETPTIEETFKAAQAKPFVNHWGLIPVPGDFPPAYNAVADVDAKGEELANVAWARCAVRLTDPWLANDSLRLALPKSPRVTQAWLNGRKLSRNTLSEESDGVSYTIPKTWVEANDANLLVLRIQTERPGESWPTAPAVISEVGTLNLAGWWQFRWGDNPAWANIPLPARYGMAADVVFDTGEPEKPVSFRKLLHHFERF